MKHRGMIIGTACLLAASAAVMGGCTFTSESESALTPSLVATSEGAAASREEFLAEQEAPSGYRKLYEEAVAEGYEGSYLEFLQALGASAGDASAGVSKALTSVVGIECRFEEYASARPSANTQTVYAAGAGVIYSVGDASGDAYIVTNYHVVYDLDSVGNESIRHISDDISVYLYGAGESITAEYVGGAMAYDIAVLRVEADAFADTAASQAPLADSDSISVGESVYAIGNPEGEGISVTSGVVSVDAEYIDILSADERTELSLLEIRTDAAVNHGNSGGGLFNAAGELVGIVNARTEEDGVDAFGYAIPINLARAVAQNVIDNHEAAAAAGEDPERGATRASLGVTVQVTASESVYNETTCKTYIEEQVTVKSITTNSAAHKMGLNIGDVVLSASIRSNGTTYREIAVTRMHMLTTFMFELRLGDTLTLTVARGEETKTLSYDFDARSDFTLYA